MTKANKLKQRVRQRAAKTGESYSTARRQVLAESDSARSKRTASAAETARTSAAKGAVSEAKCLEKTGHGFDYWFGVLDRFGAPAKGHTLAAKHLLNDHEVSAWYAQSITVAYERARGLRKINQLGDGGFAVSVSRTLPVARGQASDALAHKTKRQKWADDIEPSVAKTLDDALTQKRLIRDDAVSRIRYRTDEGAIEIRISDKDGGRSSITVAVSRLGDAKKVEVHRKHWRQALDAFKQHLTSLS